jgi:hypothetical protein
MVGPISFRSINQWFVSPDFLSMSFGRRTDLSMSFGRRTDAQSNIE